MLDIPSISSIVAATGVIVGVVFTVIELRTLVKTRQTELVNSLYSSVKTREYLEAWERFRAREITKDLVEYRKKYGFVELNMVLIILDQAGVLLRRKLIDVGLVQDFFGSNVIEVWEKYKPLFEEEERRLGKPHAYQAVEYLYGEMKNREQPAQRKI
jgi:hypothetical protein